MSWSNHEISDYIDDLPMKISNSYMPKYFHIEIPEILCLKEDDYDFKIEKETINMCELAEEEKIKETERLLQSGTLKNYDDEHHPIDQTKNMPPIVPGPLQPPPPPTPLQQPVTSVMSTTLLQQPVSNMSTPLPVHLPHHQPYPIPVNNFTTETELRCNFKEMDHNNMKQSNNELNSVVIVRRNSVPTCLNTIQDNFGILRPSQINCDSCINSNDDSRQQQQQHHHQQYQQQHQQQQQQQFIPKTRINPADFESSSSSPFDDALLRAIDDKQELNHVFQNY